MQWIKGGLAALHLSVAAAGLAAPAAAQLPPPHTQTRPVFDPVQEALKTPLQRSEEAWQNARLHLRAGEAVMTWIRDKTPENEARAKRHIAAAQARLAFTHPLLDIPLKGGFEGQFWGDAQTYERTVMASLRRDEERTFDAMRRAGISRLADTMRASALSSATGAIGPAPALPLRAPLPRRRPPEAP